MEVSRIYLSKLLQAAIYQNGLVIVCFFEVVRV